MNWFSFACVLKISCCRTPKIKNLKITICKTTINSWNFILKTQSLSFEFSLSSNFRCSGAMIKYVISLIHAQYVLFRHFQYLNKQWMRKYVIRFLMQNVLFYGKICKKFLLQIHAFSSTLFTCIDVFICSSNWNVWRTVFSNTFPLPKFASNYVTSCLQQNSNELNDKSSLWKQYEISNSVKSLKSLMIRKVSNNFISIKR